MDSISSMGVRIHNDYKEDIMDRVGKILIRIKEMAGRLKDISLIILVMDLNTVRVNVVISVEGGTEDGENHVVGVSVTDIVGEAEGLILVLVLF